MALLCGALAAAASPAIAQPAPSVIGISDDPDDAIVTTDSGLPAFRGNLSDAQQGYTTYAGGIQSVEDALAEQEAATPVASTDSGRTPGYRAKSVRGRPRPEYTAGGILAGSFRILPRVALEGGYDGNVFATANGRGDVFARAAADITARSGWSRHAVVLDGSVSQRQYAKYQSENGTEYRVSARGRLDVVGQTSIQGYALRQRVIVDRANIGEVPNTRRPLRYDESVFGLDANIVTGRIITRVGGSITNRDYVNNRTFTGVPLDFGFRSINRKEAHIDVSYQLRAAQYVFVSALYDHRNSPNPTSGIPGVVSADSDGVEVIGGIRGEITPVIRGQLGAGVLHQDFKDDRVNDATGLALNTQIEWLPTELTTLTFTAARALRTSALRTDLSYIVTSFQLRADHELLRNVLLVGQAAYDYADYRSTDRVDRRYLAVAGADWLMNRHLRSAFRISYSHRETERNLRPDFDDFGATAGVTYAF